MIAFIDLNTGNLFNGDNYTFWFDGEQSVNMYYSKSICFITDIRTLNVSLDSSVFQLARINDVKPNININDRDYIDLDKLTKVGDENIKSFSSDGYEYKGLYIHLIYVIAHSLTAGEFHDTLTIGGREFNIAADFYNGDESLIYSLTNRGDSIPWEIEKVIYDSNVREEGVDNIMLNRKFKELLMEYINILANKGSYKSLFNSLSWFEYGDLVKLKEYWSCTEFGEKTVFDEKPLNSIISTKTDELLSSHHKTSYIGLQCSLKKIKLNSDGEIKWKELRDELPEKVDVVDGVSLYYAQTNKEADSEKVILSTELNEDGFFVSGNGDKFEDGGDSESLYSANLILEKADFGDLLPEVIPEVETIAMKHSTKDMVLKMALLRNFFKTYFMPIHLDLMMSTVEDIVFANTIKITQKGAISRIDSFDNIYSCDLTCLKNTPQIHSKTNPAHYMEKCDIYVYEDTPFGTRVSKDEYETSNPKIVGVETGPRLIRQLPKELNEGEQLELTEDQQDALATHLSQRATKIGVILPFEVTFKGVSSNDIINRANLRVNLDGSHLFSTIGYFGSEHGGYNEEAQEYKANFSLFFEEPGGYDLTFDFSFVSGKSFIKKFKTRILDNTNNTIRLYTVRRHSEKDFDTLLDSTAKHPEGYNTVNEFGFSLFESGEPKMYRQFLTYSPFAVEKSIGLNDVVILKMEKQMDLEFRTGISEWDSYPVVFSDDKWIINEETDVNKPPTGPNVVSFLEDYSYTNHYYWTILERFNYPLTLVEKWEGGKLRYEYQKSHYLIGIRKVFSRSTPKDIYTVADSREITLYKNGQVTKEKYRIEIQGSENGSSYDKVVKVIFETPWKEGDVIKSGASEATVVMGEEEFVLDGENITFSIKTGDNQEAIIYKSLSDNVLSISYNIVKNGIPMNISFDADPNTLAKGAYDEDRIQLRCKVDEKYTYSDSEDRFFPLFHKLEPMKENIITEDEVVYMRPEISRAQAYELPTWEFTNRTENIVMTPTTYAMEEYLSSLGINDKKVRSSDVGIKNPFIGSYDLRVLPGKGYYSIVLNYTLSKTRNKTTLKNALLVV